MKIAYIGGGSRAWAYKYFADLLLQDKIDGELALYDIDIPRIVKNKKYFDKLMRTNPTKVKSKWTCKVYERIEEALDNVDFVIISILPNTLENMRVDVHLPEKYGIHQTVGDTVGAGGYSRALRCIEPMRFFATKVKECCPNAYVINYTNPMAMCLYALYSAFPEIKLFGCCHEVFGTQKTLASIYDLYCTLDEEGKKQFVAGNYAAVSALLKDKFISRDKVKKVTGRRDVDIDVVGINHFTWITRAEVKGVDLFPIYKGYIKMIFERNKQEFYKKLPVATQRKHNADFVKFSLFMEYGAIAAAGDRHLVEFMPDQWLYNISEETYHKNGFIKTYVKTRIADAKLRAFIQWVRLHLECRIKLEPSEEEGVHQIVALSGYGDLKSNVNRKNDGYLTGMDNGLIVETNAWFTKEGVTPIPAQNLSGKLAERIARHANNQKNFVEAYVNKDKEALFNVFKTDYCMEHMNDAQKRVLFEELIEANKDVLADFLKK